MAAPPQASPSPSGKTDRAAAGKEMGLHCCDPAGVARQALVLRVKEIYQAFVKRSDGVLEIPEMRRVIRKLCPNFQGEDVDTMVKDLDRDGGGTVSQKEFVDWLKRGGLGTEEATRGILRETGDARTARIKQSFDRYDVSGDGSLDIAELKKVLKAMGSFTNDEVRRICNDLDKSGDGEVSFQEFADWFKTGGGKGEIIKAKAILAPGDDDGLEGVFYGYCGPGHADMDGKSFVKILKDCKLLNATLTELTSDMIYNDTKVKAKGERRINFGSFETALELVAQKRGSKLEEVRNALVLSIGPILQGTKAVYVRFHDDKATHTGASGAAAKGNKLNGNQPTDATEAQARAEAAAKRTPAAMAAAAMKKKLNPLADFQVDLTRTADNKELWKAFGIHTSAGRHLKRMYSRPFVPEGQVGREPARMTFGLDTYVAVNGMLAGSDGLQFRLSMNIHARPTSEYVPWGSCVKGELVDACWLKVGNHFLPTQVCNIRLLRRVPTGGPSPTNAGPLKAGRSKSSGLTKSVSLPTL